MSVSLSIPQANLLYLGTVVVKPPAPNPFASRSDVVPLAFAGVLRELGAKLVTPVDYFELEEAADDGVIRRGFRTNPDFDPDTTIPMIAELTRQDAASPYQAVLSKQPAGNLLFCGRYAVQITYLESTKAGLLGQWVIIEDSYIAFKPRPADMRILSRRAT